MDNQCPLCGTPADLVPEGPLNTVLVVNCSNCGKFEIEEDAIPLIAASDSVRGPISHACYLTNRQGETLAVTTQIVERFRPLSTRTRHREYMNNWINFLGEELNKRGSIGGVVWKDPENWRAVIGTHLEEDVHHTLTSLLNEELVTRQARQQQFPDGARRTVWDLGLTSNGWDRYDELTSGETQSTTAFMAMEYKNSLLDKMYADCFKPAVAATGLDLRRLDEQPKLGIIDNHLRVEIRNSRVLLADLSSANQGSYWEAGYAEGLGKPVLYLCHKSVFDDENSRPHFDTNHCQTVIWDSNEMEKAAQEIKDAIRVTLPGVAKMTDD